ncbi:MAG: hypothetical protein ABSE56_03945 [Bryobacteraceae bacterium]|jgi:hypothetical protein
MTSNADRLSKGRAVVARTYYVIWNDWFGAMGISRASLCLTHECTASGYRPGQDELHLNLPEGNVEEASDDAGTNHDIPPPPGIGWPAWKRELVHELLHEYQHKVVAGRASPGGAALQAKHRGCFDDTGHGADFFTAIQEKASYFGVSPEALIANL